MTHDDIIRMAQEAGMSGLEDGGLIENFERFAELVAAEEREACAKVCDAMAHGWENNPGTNPLAGYIASSNCAVEIRAISKK